MAPISPPAWMQAGTYSARNDRLVLAGLLGYPGFTADEATPLRIRQGVRPSYQNQQLKVRAAGTPNMTVIVSAGICYIDNHDLAGYGCYVCVNDADYTVTVPAAGGAGQYRKDTIVASVYDAETAGATNEFRIELIQGPYAASAAAAVPGTLPNNAQVLAYIAVAPSQSSVTSGNISDIRNFAVASGGIVPLSSSVDMNHPAPGQTRYYTDTDRMLYGKLDGTSGELQKAPGSATSWTPTWTTSTGLHSPSYGNATVDCRYWKLGKLVLFNMNVVFGSTTNFGASAATSDNWQFSLPFQSAMLTFPVGTVMLEPGTSRGVAGDAITTADGQNITFNIGSGGVTTAVTNSGVVDSLSPWTWASGNKFHCVGQYEAVS